MKIIPLLGLVLASNVYADVSYNVGFASEYYFRGIAQQESSASAGIDYENKGFYAGAWTADVGEGLEVDGYLGYGVETASGLSVSAGFTGYYYTGEFDDTYQEINLNVGYKLASFEYSVGTWEGFGNSEDYSFFAATLQSENGLYGTYGRFGKDFEGDYIQIGWDTTVSGVDLGTSLILNSKELSNEVDNVGVPTEGEAVIFTVGKTF